MDSKFGTFHDAETGETVTRELTDEEIASIESMNAGSVSDVPVVNE